MKQLQGKPPTQQQSDNCQNNDHKSIENSSSETTEFFKCVKGK